LPLKDNPSEGGCREYPGDSPLNFKKELWEPTFWCYQRDGKPQSYWMVSVVSQSCLEISKVKMAANHNPATDRGLTASCIQLVPAWIFTGIAFMSPKVLQQSMGSNGEVCRNLIFSGGENTHTILEGLEDDAN